MSEYSDFIDDGYTEKGNIDAEAGIHGPLQFEYRPMLPAAQGRLMEKKGADEFITAVAKVLCGKDALVKSWTLKSKSEVVPLTEENVKRIKPRLLDKLWQIVAGLRPSDGADKATSTEDDAKN